MRNTSALQHVNVIYLIGLTSLLTLSSTGLAQENGELGRMWTFENPPLAYLEEEYGFKPDQHWMDSLRLGSLRLGSLRADRDQPSGSAYVLSGFGSASFVSPRGLIMTSTRCVRDAVAQTWPRDINLIKSGLVAGALEEELRLRTRQNGWVTAAQLVKISNVSDKVNKGVAPEDDEIQIKRKRKANKQKILKAARKADPKLVPQIVSLYQGVTFQLYQYRVYDDVRLVVLPHLQTAHFGGDLDNFTYPRHSIDFAFLRAYEDGKPADTAKHYFKWKSGGAKKDELVFVSGNPGTTKRLFTKAQLELERDIRIPIEIERLTNALRISKNPRSGTYDGEFDPENPSKHWAWMHTSILKSGNDLKAARGKLRGLTNESLMAQKTAAEQALKDRVMADKKLADKYGDLWDRIARVVRQRRLHETRARFHSAGGPGLLNVAVAIVRMSDPAESEEHRKQARKTFESWRGTGTRNFNFHGTAFFLDHLVRASSWLPKDDPFLTKVLDGRSPDEFWEAMAPLKYEERRDSLANAGWKAIQESEEPAIVAARELVILMRQHDKRREELDAKEEGLGAEMARAMIACYGTEVSPDATNTLRFTVGVVKGVPTGGTIAPYRTTFYGLYGRGLAFDNNYPFKLPRIWLDRKDKVDMTKSVTFVSTCDISGGNMVFDTGQGAHFWQGFGGSSGSVVVNTDLEVVGVVVDGNIESLHNDFVYRDDVPRAVSTHVDGIMEALVKIYDAHHIAEELTGSTANTQEALETPESSLPRLRDNFVVRAILEDSKGNFWFGSWDSGVARFDGKNLTYFTKEDGLDSNQVRNVFEDRNGTIWFETGDTICTYDGKKITIHTDRDYNSKNDWKLAYGDLWFKEDDGRIKNKREAKPGVYQYDGTKISFLTFPLPKVRGDDREYKCTGVARGKDGRIWFATYGSVIGYDGKSFTFMNNQSGRFDGSTETDLHVRAIFEDSKGRLWIGNNGIGVLLRENGRTINFTQKHGLGSEENRRGGPLPGDAPKGSPSMDRVFAIGEDAAGNIWFGLHGKQGPGAWRYDGKSLRHFTEKDGLTSKSISAIYRDKRGDLWLGGDGVFKFNGDSFDRIH